MRSRDNVPNRSTHETRLCVLSEKKETREQIEYYFRTVDGVDVMVVPDAPLPRADWSVVPAEQLVRIGRTTPGIKETTRIIAFGPADLLTPSFLFGCWDFMKEPWNAEELYLRIRRDAGEQLSDRSEAEELHYDATMMWTTRHAVEIRPVEFRLLEILVAHAGSLVSRDELAMALLRTRNASSRSLDMHISNLRKKMRIVSAPSPGPSIEVRRGVGYRLVEWTSEQTHSE